MVSTRGPRCKFIVGEKVLCYEPDPTKAKVLYDSKVIAVIEPKDKRSASKREIEYLIHFQGWNASWDRRVGEEFVLKDSDEHRLLQKSLAEQSQLQIGAYLYRKDQKKPQRLRNSSNSSTDTKFRTTSSDEGSSTCSMTGGGRQGVRSDESVDEQASCSGTTMSDKLPPPSTSETTTAAPTTPTKQPTDTSTEPTSPLCKITGTVNNIPRTVERPFDENTDTFSTAVVHAGSGGSGEDDRVYLHIGDLLKQHLERDWRLITQQQHLLALPVAMPAITILENWVKHYSIKACTCPTQLDAPRRRSSSAKAEKREKDYEKLVRSIALRKEVADGLRIYLNYTVRDHLLYGPEREQAAYYLSAEYRTANLYVAPERQTLDMLSGSAKAGGTGDGEDSQSGSATDMRDALPATAVTANASLAVAETAEPTKRRLRSYKHDESEYILDIGVSGTGASGKTGDKSSVVSNSSGNSTTPQSTLTFASLSILRSLLPLGIGISMRSRDILQNVLAWQIVPTHTPMEPSMVWGATHLARLIVKLPDFLNATSMPDEKLKTILKYVDSFIEFLEIHPEWFGEDHYREAALAFPRPIKLETVSADIMNEPSSAQDDYQSVDKIEDESAPQIKVESINIRS